MKQSILFENLEDRVRSIEGVESALYSLESGLLMLGLGSIGAVVPSFFQVVEKLSRSLLGIGIEHNLSAEKLLEQFFLNHPEGAYLKGGASELRAYRNKVVHGATAQNEFGTDLRLVFREAWALVNYQLSVLASRHQVDSAVSFETLIGAQPAAAWFSWILKVTRSAVLRKLDNGRACGAGLQLLELSVKRLALTQSVAGIYAPSFSFFADSDAAADQDREFLRAQRALSIWADDLEKRFDRQVFPLQGLPCWSCGQTSLHACRSSSIRLDKASQSVSAIGCPDCDYVVDDRDLIFCIVNHLSLPERYAAFHKGIQPFLNWGVPDI